MPLLLTDTGYEKFEIFRYKLNLKLSKYLKKVSWKQPKHLFLLTKDIFLTFPDCLPASAFFIPFLQNIT